MPRQIKPQTKKELFVKVLQMWFYTEKKNINSTVSKEYRRSKLRGVADKYREYLSMWDCLKW